MKKRNSILVSLVLLAAMLLSACGSSNPPAAPAQSGTNSNETKVLKLGHIAAPGTAYDNFANEFKRQIEEKSNSRYVIDVYPAGQLGVDRELMESLQVGNVDFTVITASDINQFVPDMAVQDLPFLFMNWDHVFKFLESNTAKEFAALTDSVGMKTLGFMPRGFRHVTSSIAPVNTPNDLKGLKIRVAESEVYIDTFKNLGANAQAMAWGEVFTALQQGTIDAHENTVITTRDYKINEVQKYMSETGHFFAFAMMQMNTDLFNSMSPEDQKMFTEIGYEVAAKLGKEQQENEAAAKKELESLGMVFNEVKDKQAFVDLVQPVYDKFLKSHDSKYVDAIRALQ
ncbi:TRAP transporter substrate-binding protein [Sedimentibacter hydroxybenzoicus DSM 7310]|uniref:TRAP transporter substrate-binding protein n=1 Tax=Sedimentibacter hydroxybenzoicus DSM 7310 TaxID=1123245 RepID=A0A974BKW7_SEDHY|nr:TRAP transporter substrate-binding protein [Sedimentibacter hydroxybenzoicus]NYB75064.1 TRAP transporter substrate-binding protein [Sedimentibacter hydroxybenzoicus DSM 7310]